MMKKQTDQGADITCPFTGQSGPASFHSQMLPSSHLKDSEKTYQQLKPEELPVMGCPFLSKDKANDDPRGKNLTRGYSLKYISKLEFLFESKRVSKTERRLLDSLPFAVKHSLFLEPGMMGKMRDLADVGQLFFITDDTKIRGNRAYDSGRYYEALESYEQVLGCFLWLSPKEGQEAFEEKVFKTFKFAGLKDSDIEVKEKQVVREEDKEIENETKMAMLVGCLLNSALAYMSMHHFEEAHKCVEYMIENYWKDPQLYFRRAQLVYLNQASTLKELKEAKDYLEKECLNETVLAGKRWQDSLKRFRALKDKFDVAIQDRIDEDYANTKMLLKFASRLLEDEDGTYACITQGNQVQESREFEQFEILKIMNTKYAEIVQFFRDANNQEKLQMAANEYQQFAKVFHRMKTMLEFEHNSVPDEVFEQLKEKHLATLRDPRLASVIEDAKYEIAESIFFHAENINSEIYDYAQQLYHEKKLLKLQRENKQKTIDWNADDTQKDRPPIFSLASFSDPYRASIINIFLALFAIFVIFYVGGYNYDNSIFSAKSPMHDLIQNMKNQRGPKY